MKYRQLGKTGWNVSTIGYGGVVSSQHFDRAVIPGDGQKMSDEYVSWAVEHGINYFDVAPGYGDAQLLFFFLCPAFGFFLSADIHLHFAKLHLFSPPFCYLKPCAVYPISFRPAGLTRQAQAVRLPFVS